MGKSFSASCYMSVHHLNFRSCLSAKVRFAKKLLVPLNVLLKTSERQDVLDFGLPTHSVQMTGL